MIQPNKTIRQPQPF